ncbi:YqgQ family protein [Microaerobacter geothermalis]|uniref:YqgQ family protein n=1 Tax=Microaerobacter geothermalis TaxID=674972 RepID=UPI001F328B2A|nr:YqgQ family protein [Microaerobacter geothermalis]MCF6094159.1 YqgQ family protein [Microaerobacter geothermalis]
MKPNQTILSIFHLKELLREFRVLIYTGDPLGDLWLMEEELRELYQMKLISDIQYQQGIQVIRKETKKLEESGY